MRLGVRIEGDLRVALRVEAERSARVVTQAIGQAQTELKAAWRGQVRGALGARLANSIRGETYPKGTASLDAAALVWAKAPHIVGAYEEGALIRSPNGFWLAIPLPAAGRAGGGRKMTPARWERQTGQRLRFVYRRGRTALLVAEDARLSRRGLAAAKKGRRRRDGMLSGAQTVPIFVLVPQVRLAKRLDLSGEIGRVHASLAAIIAAGLGDR
ncbi:DUF6441 family protein [Rubellimicrobium aerolatum]|uniref:DUF6441 family protein n=1 Tax=Rubellimicrobium aerolatum TaxID=490979 RepID=A0ABW0SEW8_9RHOB|nr:DUF6441 family protein [Rubellimicrobium aerolatum]MBP1806464.1 hypothetical protein [Rubellimicrobium aerolatum]